MSELLGADIEDLGTDRGHRVLRVRRKGGKIQALALPAPAAARIDAYLAGRDDVTALPATALATADPCSTVVILAGAEAPALPGGVPQLRVHVDVVVILAGAEAPTLLATGTVGTSGCNLL